MNEVTLEQHLLGRSRVMRRLRSDILKLARSDLAVLIEGPTGAGKELVAQAIHLASGRSGGFVAFNVCAIADSMFEDALFGHVRGAFTGALADVSGYIAEADRGTLFLDEIGGLSGVAQAKLLRVLETREYRAVGGRVNKHSNFRMVAATNVDLLGEVDAGRLRADLAYRLSGDILRVPSLDERREDVPLLAEHFVRQIGFDGGRSLEIAPAALDVLTSVDWPGNVRELRNTVRRAAAHAAGSVIGGEDMRQAIRRGGRQTIHIDDPRRLALVALLERFTWNVDEVAREMAVHPVTVYRRMKQFSLRRPNSQGRPLFADAP